MQYQILAIAIATDRSNSCHIELKAKGILSKELGDEYADNLVPFL